MHAGKEPYQKPKTPRGGRGGGGPHQMARGAPQTRALQDLERAVLHGKADVAVQQVVDQGANQLEAPALAKRAILRVVDVIDQIVARGDHGGAQRSGQS